MTALLSVPAFLDDALIVLGMAAIMLVGFVLINVGLWLPGVLDWFNKKSAGEDRVAEPGSGVRPLIEPAPCYPSRSPAITPSRQPYANTHAADPVGKTSPLRDMAIPASSRTAARRNDPEHTAELSRQIESPVPR